MELMFIVSLSLFGYILPEFFVSMGGSKATIPCGQNLISFSSALLFALWFIYG